MESRRNGPQLSSRHDDDDDVARSLCVSWAFLYKLVFRVDNASATDLSQHQGAIFGHGDVTNESFVGRLVVLVHALGDRTQTHDVIRLPVVHRRDVITTAWLRVSVLLHLLLLPNVLLK